MSELKDYKMVDEKYCTDCVCVIPSEVYLKSEADKAIAEKDKEIDELQDKVTDLLLRDRNMALNFNNAVDALAHTKYKRCLAMAKRCDVTALFYGNAIPKVLNKDITDPRRQKVFRRLSHYKKWYKRWLEIAEKFEHNSTAQ